MSEKTYLTCLYLNKNYYNIYNDSSRGNFQKSEGSYKL